MLRGFSTARGSQHELEEVTQAGLHRTHIALLAQSRSGAVRELVARRDDMPFGVQAALSNDDLREVREAVAANPRAALSVLLHLAGDPHHGVLIALVRNPNAPREVAERLANHKRADVRYAAVRRLETREHPVSAIECDPDAHIPELRERAQRAPESITAAPRTSFGEEFVYPGDTTLSRLAQHLTERHLASTPSLRVAAVS